MPSNVRVHLAAAGLLALIATVIVVFWAYPKLLVYLLLAIVAVLAYGALYLILASWMDPKKAESSASPAARTEPDHVGTPAPPEEPPEEPPEGPPQEPPKRAKKARKKRATKARKKRKVRRKPEP
jgi:hypothetical protein